MTKAQEQARHGLVTIRREGEDPTALPLTSLEASVARQLAMGDAMRIRGSLTQALDLVLLVGLEVTLEPVPLVGMLLGPLPREDVGGDAIQEPTVVRDNDGATGESQEGILQGAQRLDVQVVGRLVQQEQVAALLEGQGQVQAVTLTTGEDARRLLLIRPLEAEGRHVGARGHLDIADLDEVQTVGHNLPQRLVRIDAGA